MCTSPYHMVTKPKLFVYVREYFWEIYTDIFSKMPSFDAVIVTDFGSHGVPALNPIFHRQLRRVDLPITSFDEGEIMRRCRLLRNLSPTLARKMIRAMYATILELISQQAFCAIIGQAVDDYITHLFSLIAERRSIPYLGLCSSYFPGYTQVCLGWNGLGAKGYVASPTESQAVLEAVSGREFRQDYNILTKYNAVVHAKRVVRYWIKRTWFTYLRRIHKVPFHLHYLVQPFLGQQKRLRDYPFSSCFHEDWRQRIDAATQPVIYLPLGHTPEAGTDYMIGDTSFINYEDVILNIVKTLSSSMTVLVKDHFHMSGVRRTRFYTDLKTIDGVILVPSGVNSNSLLSQYVSRVLVGAGSVGIEATIRGKQVFTFSASAYWYEASGALHLDLKGLEKWPEQISSAKFNGARPEVFIQSCLSAMLPFDYMCIDPKPQQRVSQVEAFLVSVCRGLTVSG